MEEDNLHEGMLRAGHETWKGLKLWIREQIVNYIWV